MRIAIVHPYWDFEEVAYALPQALSSEGHAPFLLVWGGDRKFSATMPPQASFNVIKLPGINLSPFGRRQKYPLVLGLESTVKAIKPSVIDCQSHLFLTAPESLRAAKKSRIPVVITINGIMAKRDMATNLVQEAYLHTIGRAIFQQAAAVRCLNTSDAAEAVRYGCPPGKIAIIPNFVDTDLFSPPQVRTGRAIVAWSGRFVAEKDVITLVRAAKIVLSERPDVEFVLMGDGPLKPTIESIVQGLGISKNFSFTGSIPRSSVSTMLKDSAIFVLPSLKEGMPLSILEAMSCRSAVVGSDIPALRALVRHNETGLLVPARDAHAFAGALITLLDDEALRERLGSNASMVIGKYYSRKKVIKKLVQLYSDVGGADPVD